MNNFYQPDSPDWEFTGLFEAGASNSSLRDIEGNWIEVMNPVLGTRSMGLNVGETTYTFRTTELRAIAALLYERLKPDIHRLPNIQPTDTFPY
jgi:hypothetical protein